MDTPSSTPQPTPSSSNFTINKKQAYIIGGVAAFLLAVIIGGGLYLLSANKDTKSTQSQDQPSNQQTNEDKKNNNVEKTVIKTIPLKNPKLELIVYEPKQTATNTTIFYAIRNTCKDCTDSISAGSQHVDGYVSDAGKYILDENIGQKYNVIKDADGEALETPSCSGYIKYDQKVECFIAFSKVPAGSTVSLILGDTRIDDVKVN